MITKLKVADYLTLGNLVCGIISIHLASQGFFLYASYLILLGVVFDYLDGKVARLLNQTSELGAQLDSFADAFTFGAATAFLLYYLFPIDYFGMILILFILSGVLRLSRYNITSGKTKEKTKHFEGTPITLNGIIFPLLVILQVNYFIILACVVILTITMVSKIKIPHA
ncbi:CDP-diacylglycerol--serine O-phosphatidyltransferase [archaeon D22]|nr:CDP-diacylglycerol--serine O-phosphatidyltransferase [archaeon D22]